MPLTASAGVPPIVLVGESRIGAVAYDLGDSGHRGDRVVVGDDAGSVTVWEGELRKWSYTGHTDRTHSGSTHTPSLGQSPGPMSLPGNPAGAWPLRPSRPPRGPHSRPRSVELCDW